MALAGDADGIDGTRIRRVADRHRHTVIVGGERQDPVLSQEARRDHIPQHQRFGPVLACERNAEMCRQFAGQYLLIEKALPVQQPDGAIAARLQKFAELLQLIGRDHAARA